MNSEIMVNIVATSDNELSHANGEREFPCQKKSDSTMPNVKCMQGTTQCAPAMHSIQELADGNNVDALSIGWCLSECNEGKEITTMTKTTIEKILPKESQNTLGQNKQQKMAPALPSQSSVSLLLQTDTRYFNPEVIGKNRTQHKSWRSGVCTENTETLSMLGLYTAPAFIFTRRKMKSHITNILINIARQIGSFGGITANKIGGIRGNIDAFTGWRIRDNEGKVKTETTQMTTKTAMQSRTEGMQNTSHQQQTSRIQHFAPALLFSAINNHILFAEVSKE